MDSFEIFDGGEESYLIKFYKHAANILNWGELKDETVILLGRGDGNDCLKLLQTFPRIRKIIDINCLNIARRNWFRNDRVVIYGKSTFASNYLSKFQGASKILCVICLTFISKKQVIFRDIYRTLANGGSAACIFFVHSSYQNSMRKIFQAKWYIIKRQWLLFPFWYSMQKLPPFENQLREIGFEIRHVRKESLFKRFSTIEEYEDWILSVTWFKSEEMRRKKTFQKEAFNILMKYHPRNSDSDLPQLFVTSFQVFLLKSVEGINQFHPTQSQNHPLISTQVSDLTGPPLINRRTVNFHPMQISVSNPTIAQQTSSNQYSILHQNPHLTLTLNTNVLNSPAASFAAPPVSQELLPFYAHLSSHIRSTFNSSLIEHRSILSFMSRFLHPVSYPNLTMFPYPEHIGYQNPDNRSLPTMISENCSTPVQQNYEEESFMSMAYENPMPGTNLAPMPGTNLAAMPGIYPAPIQDTAAISGAYAASMPEQYGAPMPEQYGAPMPGQYGAPMPGQYGAPMPEQYGAPMRRTEAAPLPENLIKQLSIPDTKQIASDGNKIIVRITSGNSLTTLMEMKHSINLVLTGESPTLRRYIGRISTTETDTGRILTLNEVTDETPGDTSGASTSKTVTDETVKDVSGTYETQVQVIYEPGSYAEALTSAIEERGTSILITNHGQDLILETSKGGTLETSTQDQKTRVGGPLARFGETSKNQTHKAITAEEQIIKGRIDRLQTFKPEKNWPQASENIIGGNLLKQGKITAAPKQVRASISAKQEKPPALLKLVIEANPLGKEQFTGTPKQAVDTGFLKKNKPTGSHRERGAACCCARARDIDCCCCARARDVACCCHRARDATCCCHRARDATCCCQRARDAALCPETSGSSRCPETSGNSRCPKAKETTEVSESYCFFEESNYLIETTGKITVEKEE